MANLVKWIEEVLERDEIVEGVVIGQMGWGDYGKEAVPQYDAQIKGRVLSWDEAKPMLDYEFDRGYGAPGCNAITVWTNTNIHFVTQYDGSTGLDSIPRSPVDYMPYMPGG